MTVLLIAPEIAVNTDKVESVHYITGTDVYREKHVIVEFSDLSVELDPQYTVDEICAALDGKCYYRPIWTDEVGELDVCVLHGNNSKHDVQVFGPFRLCLTQDPYVTYDFSPQLRETHAPDITQSWEFQKKKHTQETEEFLNATVAPDLTPVAEYMSLTPQINDYIELDYTSKKKRPFWERIFPR